MPTVSENLFLQAVALHQAGRLADAEKLYRDSLAADPAQLPALHNLIVLARQRGDFAASADFARRAIAAEPDNPRAHNALADALRHQGGDEQLEESLAAYDRALALNPAYLEALANRGAVLQRLGRTAEAIANWQTLIPLAAKKPEAAFIHFAALSNIASAHLEQGDIAEAHRLQRQAMQLKPDSPTIHSDYLLGLNYLPDTTPEQSLAAHRDWWARHAAGITPFKHPAPDPTDRPLRIGFVSCDFRIHPVAAFLLPLFESFDRSRFRFFCYANIPTEDAMTPRFRELATAWRSIVHLSDPAAADLIRKDQIDILIDLGGHTGHSRLLVFAYKPAPLQVSWLGYPATTGSALIDYRITDAIADPPGLTDAHYAEKLHRLDRPAWCFRPPAIVSGLRTQHSGLDFTFASFNNITKITPQQLHLWSQILTAVPASRLLLKLPSLANASLCQRFRDRFAAHGIAPDRLHLLGRFPNPTDYLAAYRDVDLALDTYPYHGTTTTCEALYMNVPVLTLAGPTHHSRVGASLLTAVGLTDLITDSPEHYKALAIKLATTPAALAPLRENLRHRLEHSPLMGARTFTHDFCRALRTMWRHYARPK